MQKFATKELPKGGHITPDWETNVYYTSIDPKQQRQSELSFLADPFLAPNLRPASRHGQADRGKDLVQTICQLREECIKNTADTLANTGRQMYRIAAGR